MSFYSNIKVSKSSDIGIYSKILNKKSSDIGLYSNIISFEQQNFGYYTNINATRLSYFGLYTDVSDSKLKTLELYTKISEEKVNESSFGLFTKIVTSDFLFEFYDKETNNPINDIEWSFIVVKNDTFILIDSGSTTSNTLNIYLDDYNLLKKNNEFYFNFNKIGDFDFEANIKFLYYYHQHSNRKHYLVKKLYLNKKKTSQNIVKIGGGVGGGAEIITVRSKLLTKQNIEVLCDLKENITVKSKLINKPYD